MPEINYDSNVDETTGTERILAERFKQYLGSSKRLRINSNGKPVPNPDSKKKEDADSKSVLKSDQTTEAFRYLELPLDPRQRLGKSYVG